MDDKEKENLARELLHYPHILKLVQEFQLTREQIFEALPIFLDMKDQDPNKNEYITEIYVSSTGIVKRNEVLSPLGMKKNYLSKILSQKFFPQNFNDSEDYFREPERKLLFYKMSKVLAEESPKGLYIYGPMGVGKTFTIKRLAKKLAEKGHSIAIVDVPTLVITFKSNFDNSEKREQIISILKKAEYVFLDDIGAESISSWFRDDILFSILNYRMDQNLITFFTSNYSYSKLEKIQSQNSNQKSQDGDKAKRLLDRIRNLSTEIFLGGTNKRHE